MAITSHKVAASRDRNINIRIRILLFRFRILITTSCHKIAATWIRGKRLSKPLSFNFIAISAHKVAAMRKIM